MTKAENRMQMETIEELNSKIAAYKHDIEFAESMIAFDLRRKTICLKYNEYKEIIENSKIAIRILEAMVAAVKNLRNQQ